MQKTYYRFTDGPCLSPEFSGHLRDGKISPKHGTGAYRVPIDPRGEWSATTCDWCDGLIASAYLNDHAQFFVDLVLDADREIYAELTRPHRCQPMVEADKCDDPAEAFLRELVAGNADQVERDQAATETTKASQRGLRPLSAQARALRARFERKSEDCSRA